MFFKKFATSKTLVVLALLAITFVNIDARFLQSKTGSSSMPPPPMNGTGPGGNGSGPGGPGGNGTGPGGDGKP
jgi:hypothetical protein